VEDRLRSRLKSPVSDLLSVKSAGRDFGGSASGNTSQAGSDTEFSAEEDTRKRLAKGKILVRTGMGHGNGGLNGGAMAKKQREVSGMARGAMADALGDQSDVGSDAGSEAEPELMNDLIEQEKEDKSIKGSVY